MLVSEYEKQESEEGTSDSELKPCFTDDQSDGDGERHHTPMNKKDEGWWKLKIMLMVHTRVHTRPMCLKTPFPQPQILVGTG